MPRDLKAINEELQAVVRDIAIYRKAGFSNEDALNRFHALMAEEKAARRAEAVWRVYFMHAQEAGLVKIGATSSLNSRLMALQNGGPVPLVLIGLVDGGKSVEREIHNQWAHLRSHGEWFQASADLISYIRTRAA